jgi:Proteasome beta subunits C terminal
MLRNYIKPNERYVSSLFAYTLLSVHDWVNQSVFSVHKERNYKFSRGSTAWTSESIRSLITEEKITLIGGNASGTPGEADAMDTS